jgi:four helix bundle protein
MDAQQLRDRIAAFAASVVVFCRKLRAKPEARNIASQLSDSATAIPANYRSACRARSRREFISKLAVAVEEADETVGWLELIVQAGVWPEPDVDPLRTEAHELLAILSASRRTAERNDPTREQSPHKGAHPAPPPTRPPWD